MSTHSTWMITGVSRGLGRELAEALLDDGATVVGTTRSGRADFAHDRLHVLGLDVTDPDQPAAAVARAIELTGGLDVVVNCAGSGLLGAIEATSEREALDTLETNLLGPWRVIAAAAGHLRGRGRGTIVNVSSIAGLAPLGGSGIYAAAKSGLSALSEALAVELHPFGVGVMSVEPGSLRTDFFSDASIQLTAGQPDAYAETIGAVVSMMTGRSGAEMGDPRKVARLIIDAVSNDDPPRHLVVGADAIERTRVNVAALLDDVDRWERRSAATAFEPA
ncbi:MAG: SDR family NAD(P)-dependent oxidoreductase [Solirubrobacteraceae bacterium]|nr:SDR family NAD(P)-dependent oxidoreductase [Solirubrobacteraceae bacterium]